MSKESLLKKEFKHSDVQRVRNLVNKDFTKGTKLQTGYKKTQGRYKEGDIWEENGKQWTIKNGLKQNVTKLDTAKKAIQIPLKCPKCSGPMKHHLAKKMYRIHGFCFNCTVDMEASLRRAGLYEQYEKRMMSGNLQAFADDIDAWVEESFTASSEFVTEDGTVEDWGGMGQEKLKEVLSSFKEYTNYIRSKV